MTKRKIKENLVHRRDIILKDTTADMLEEVEYLFTRKCYDDLGNIISESEYNPDGSILQESLYRYNSKSLLQEEIIYDGAGEVLEHKSFEYGEDGKVVKEFTHYLDSTFDTVNFHYNDGVLIKKECTGCENEIESIEEMEIVNGLVQRKIFKDSDAEIVSEQKMTYDEKNRLHTLSEIKLPENEIVRRTEYDYYTSGNKKSILVFDETDELIERALFDEDHKGQIVKVEEETRKKKNTTIFAFDDRGNIIFQEETDLNGQLANRLERVYDENDLLLSSTVFISGEGRKVSKNYTLRYEYIYF